MEMSEKAENPKETWQIEADIGSTPGDRDTSSKTHPISISRRFSNNKNVKHLIFKRLKTTNKS